MLRGTSDSTLADHIDAVLPQTQCTRCGYPRCRAYAEAIARREADIDQCPPGGTTTIGALAAMLGVATQPLNPQYGVHEPRARAVIDEARCIGCRKCIDACPVDAIVGTNKWMHTVIAAQCSGCALCVAPCPVDCLVLVPVAADQHGGPWPEYAEAEARNWRARTEARLARLARGREQQIRSGAPRASALPDAPPPDRIRTEIQAAIQRVKRKRALSSDSDRR